MSGPLNSSKPTTSVIVGGVYNATTPAPANKQALALQQDNEGNLLVNVAVGGGGGGGAVDISGHAGGILDAVAGAAAPANVLQVGGTDGTDLRAFATDSNGQLKVLVENSPSVSGTVTAEIEGHAGAILDGTAGSPSTGVLTVQGVSGGTLVPVASNKDSSILTTTPLSANATYTSAWFDSTLNGDVSVFVTFFSNVINASCHVLTSDDTTNTNSQQSQIITSAGLSAGAQGVQISQRYWQVVYVNGTTNQTSFELTATGANAVPQIGLLTTNFVASNTVPLAALKTAPLSASGVSDGNSTYQMIGHGSSVGILGVGNLVYTAGTNGTSALQRTPSVFHTAQATASGNTALWTPTTGKKFRMMRFNVQVTANAYLDVGAGTLTVTFQDATTGIPIAFDIYLPAASVSAPLGDAYNSGWIDLGNGILSVAANNVLNINLSGKVDSGNVRVNVCGTEE